jgi:hypothetical protein
VIVKRSISQNGNAFWQSLGLTVGTRSVKVKQGSEAPWGSGFDCGVYPADAHREVGVAELSRIELAEVSAACPQIYYVLSTVFRRSTALL